MITRLTQTQITHVLAGRDVLGRAYGKALTITNCEHQRHALAVWIQGAFHHRPGRLTIPQRTELIRKFAAFMTRDNNRAHGSDIADATRYLLARPQLLTTKLTFGGVVRLVREQRRRRQNQHDEDETARVIAAAKTPVPPRPVIATHGAYALHQLVHPIHLRNTGLAAGNCLAIPHSGSHIANPTYWDAVASKRTSIFTLHHNQGLCLVVAITHNRIAEWQLVSATPGMAEALQHCLAALTPPPPLDGIRYMLRAHTIPPRPQGRVLAANAEPPYLPETIDRALRGDLPDGPPLKPLALNRRAATMQPLRATLTHFAQLTNGASPEDMIRFARKLAVYLTRHPSPDAEPLIRGAGYFAANRQTLRSKLSFAGAARLQGVMWRAFENRQRRQLKAYVKSQLDLPLTAPRLLLARHDYRLTMLTHPRHLVDLAVKTKTKRLVAWIDGRAYPHRVYADQLLSGDRRFFTLSRADHICLWFASIDTSIIEMHVITPHEELVDILADCVPAVERITGPIVHAAGIWPQPEHECRPLGTYAAPRSWIHPRTPGVKP
ncbi:hypothetical protein [Hyphomicrobium sp. DY-1]|uniref:hypothetical protein n=1 Tax=Hyphomicrobium sp. DY-1 TaxID=3075650 RepID=UPI0039C0D69C